MAQVSLRRLPAIPSMTLAIVVAGFGGGAATPGSSASCAPSEPFVGPAAAVSWPPSTGLLVSEVVTGGASASDEFVELYNASSAALDLAGLELVYVTSTGSTVTRKQSWTQLSVPAHAHVLLANSAGGFASTADGLYSGGFSATGGSLVLRTIGGPVVDSLSWGDATSALVEGTAGLAPAATWSLERLPGGGDGNGVDTNDNVADTWINAAPVAQSLSSPPVPGATPTPGATATATPPEATPAPTASWSPAPSPIPTLEATPGVTPVATASAEPSLTPQPTPCVPPLTEPPTPRLTPTASPTRSPAPTPTATTSATPAPTASATSLPTAAPIAIAGARALPVGSRVTVRGVVTVAPGWILGDTTTALQDETGGIFVRLPSMSFDGIVPGRMMQVEGVLADPFGNLEIRPAASGVVLLHTGSLPTPVALDLDALGEPTEGLLARARGTISRIDGNAPSSITLILGDDSGEGRVFAHATLGLTREEFAVGQEVSVIGLVGDRLGLYRIWPRNRFDITIDGNDPTPSATASRSPRPTPRATPRPTPTRRPSVTPRHTPSARPSSAPAVSISEALRRQGQTVALDGVVTTRNGLLDADAERVTLQDASGAILVRLPDGVTVQVGQRLRVTGKVGTYYNAPQLTATSASRLADAAVQPLTVRSAPIAPTLEWRLVTVSGQVESVRRDGDAWRAELLISGGGVPVVGLARSGIESTALEAGRAAVVTGIVKRAYPTASDQRFAIVPRTAADIKLGAAAGSSHDGGIAGSTPAPDEYGAGNSGAPYASGSASATASPVVGTQAEPYVALAELSAYQGQRVRAGGAIVGIEDGRLSIDDGTATATVRLHGAASDVDRAVRIDNVINVVGEVALDGAGELEIVVDDPTDIVWSQTLQPTAPLASLSPTRSLATLAVIDAGDGSPTASATDARLAAAGIFGLALALLTVGALASPERRRRLRERLAVAANALKQRWGAVLKSG